MKKKIFITIITATVLLMSACGGSKGDIDQIQAENESLKIELESIREENEALLSEKTTMATKETEVATSETIQTEEETEAPDSTSSWELKYYIDEFDRPTDEFYVFGVFKGNFSNSAANNRPLAAAFYIDRYLYNNKISDCVGITLFEYETNPVNNIFSDGRYYSIQILEENDNVITEKGYIGGKSDTIYVWGDEDQNSIINALKNNQKLTFRIDEEDGMSTYLFDVDCTGFKETFESADWKV